MQSHINIKNSQARRLDRQAGLTLIELMVVVAIISVLGAIVVAFAGSTKSKATSLLSSMDGLGTGASMLNQDGGCYPVSLRALVQQADAANTFCGINMMSNWRGPYTKNSTFNAAGYALLDSVAAGITASITKDTSTGVTRYGVVAANVPDEILTEADSQCNKSAGSVTCTTTHGTGGAPGQIIKWFDSHA